MDLGSGFQMRHGWRKSASTVLGTRLICEKNDVSTLSNVKNSDELSFATFAARDTLQQYVDSPDRRTREDSPRTLYGCARAPRAASLFQETEHATLATAKDTPRLIEQWCGRSRLQMELHGKDLNVHLKHLKV